MYTLADLRAAFDAGAAAANTPNVPESELFNLFFLSLKLPLPPEEEETKVLREETKVLREETKVLRGETSEGEGTVSIL